MRVGLASRCRGPDLGNICAASAWWAEPYPGAVKEHMRVALDEAQAAMEHGDVPVGAVVVTKDGRVIGRGHNTRERDGDPLGHAEVNAIAQAAKTLGSWRLEDCTLVVTLEPCAMCAGAIVNSRVQHLVFGAFDDKAGAVGSVFEVVRDRRLNHRPEVTAGVLAEESAALLREFFATHRE